MVSAFYAAWQRSGGRYQLAYPVADLAATLRRYGYTVGTIGDASHMNAATPEDHTPFSRTGWPTAAPFGWVFALDIMPAGGNLPSLAELGARLAADRNAGHPGAAPIKYMNWTPAGAGCRHESWEPGHWVAPSSDTGHIHISVRTDFQLSHAMAGYDPVAGVRAGGAAPATAPAAPVGVPQWPGRVLAYTGRPLAYGSDVRQAQARLRARGWTITVDGWYGSQTAGVITRFQQDSTAHRWPLDVDGKLGPHTWDALWRRPIS